MRSCQRREWLTSSHQLEALRKAATATAATAGVPIGDEEAIAGNPRDWELRWSGFGIEGENEGEHEGAVREEGDGFVDEKS